MCGFCEDIWNFRHLIKKHDWISKWNKITNNVEDNSSQPKQFCKYTKYHAMVSFTNTVQLANFCVSKTNRKIILTHFSKWFHSYGKNQTRYWKKMEDVLISLHIHYYTNVCCFEPLSDFLSALNVHESSNWVHNVFSLAEILKIFLSETTKSIELWLCRNDHWVVLY
jgi:hypothetical protein